MLSLKHLLYVLDDRDVALDTVYVSGEIYNSMQGDGKQTIYVDMGEDED
jgi:hypothetical protein